MKKLSMLVAAAFTFVSMGVIAAPKAAESAGGQVVSASTSVPMPQAKAKAKSGKKKPGKKSVKKAM